MNRIARLLCLGALVAGSAASAAAQRLAVLRGQVVSDSGDRPIAGAEVAIPAHSVSVVADSAGMFRLAGIPPGRTIVWARRFGFAPVSAVLNFTAGDTLERDFVLARVSTSLPGVRVSAPSPVPTKFAEFERRRKAGFGHFMTREQLANMETYRMAEILELIPGTSIQRPNTGAAAYVAGPRSSMGAGRVCYAAIVIDGIIVYDGKGPVFDINMVAPSQVAGIEYYGGPATVPAEYRSARAGCGMVVIWTR